MSNQWYRGERLFHVGSERLSLTIGVTKDKKRLRITSDTLGCSYHLLEKEILNFVEFLSQQTEEDTVFTDTDISISLSIVANIDDGAFITASGGFGSSYGFSYILDKNELLDLTHFLNNIYNL